MNHNHFPTASTPDPELSQDPNQTPKQAIPDLPTTSPNPDYRFYLREIERLGRTTDVKNFLLDTADRDFHVFEDPIDLDAFSEAYSEFSEPFLSPEDKSALKRYTGFNYKLINQVSRGIWSYDHLGVKTPEKVAEAEQTISAISQAIDHIPSPGVDLIAYRGTNIDSFRNYGISSLSDLASLEGQFFLEAGFTSTSLSPNHSFAGKEFDDPLRRSCDINITCRIPKEARETVGLLSAETAYNPSQHELLIDKGSLFFISATEISPDRSSAHLEMTLIPRDLYDPAPPSTD